MSNVVPIRSEATKMEYVRPVHFPPYEKEILAAELNTILDSNLFRLDHGLDIRFAEHWGMRGMSAAQGAEYRLFFSDSVDSLTEVLGHRQPFPDFWFIWAHVLIAIISGQFTPPKSQEGLVIRVMKGNTLFDLRLRINANRVIVGAQQASGNYENGTHLLFPA